MRTLLALACATPLAVLAYPCCVFDKPSSSLAIHFGSRYFVGCPSGGALSYAVKDLAHDCSCSVAQTCNHTQPFTFRCPDGRQIPHTQVNDDVCDCGTDEPVTSACASASSGNAAAAAAAFLCTNGGFMPVLVPASRVNDGLVDCCDCTDEPHVLGCDPEQSCSRLREQVTRKRQARVTIVRAGLEALKLAPPEQHLASMREELAKASDELARGSSAREAWRKKLEALELKSNERKQELRVQWKRAVAHSLPEGALVRVVADSVLNKTESELGLTLLLLYNVAGLGDALRAEADLNGRVRAIKESTVITDKQAAVGTLLKLADAPGELLLNTLHPGNNRALLDVVRAHVSPEQGAAWEQQVVAMDADDDELVIARADSEEAQKDVRRAEETVERLTKVLAHNFGPDGVLASLAQPALSFKQGEYEYVVHAFGDAEQKKPAAPHEGAVLLGKFESWSLVKPGDAIPEQIAEGDEAPAPKVRFSYTDGRRCQVTPRSAVMYVRCGPDTHIVSVVEPSPCMYVMLATSPCVCAEETLNAEAPPTSWTAVIKGLLPSSWI